MHKYMRFADFEQPCRVLIMQLLAAFYYCALEARLGVFDAAFVSRRCVNTHMTSHSMHMTEVHAILQERKWQT